MTLSEIEKKRKEFLITITELRIREAEVWHEREKRGILIATGIMDYILGTKK